MSKALYLGRSKIEWVSNLKHLGNYVNSDVTDETECDMKCSNFIGYVNTLRGYSNQTHFFIIEILFTIYIKICVPIVN